MTSNVQRLHHSVRLTITVNCQRCLHWTDTDARLQIREDARVCPSSASCALRAAVRSSDEISLGELKFETLVWILLRVQITTGCEWKTVIRGLG